MAVMACDDEVIPLPERIETVGDDVVSWLDGASGAAHVFPDAHPDR